MIADYKARERQFDQRQRKMNRNSALKDYVMDQLKLGWSPEQIAGRLRVNLGKTIICHETIYAYIYSSQGNTKGLYKYLSWCKPKRYPKIYRRTRVLIPNRTYILERPAYINDRSELSHWEADFMLFNKASKTNFLTLRERKTRYLIAIKNTTRSAKTVASTFLNAISNRYKKAIK